MTKAVEQRSESPGSEVKEPKTPQEQFLNDLYGKIYDWLIRKQRGKVLATFGPTHIEDWDVYESYPPSTIRLDLDLQKAVIIETKDRQFALVLGNKQFTSHNGQTLHLQFGALPVNKRIRNKENSIDKLRSLIDQRLVSPGSGEFYINDDEAGGKVDIHSWADDIPFGGQNISAWEQKKILSKKGLNACLGIVQRTSKNAFV